MDAITAVVDSAHFVLGSRVAAFEEAIADYTASLYAIGVASGSDALLVALMALNTGEDDCVVTTPYTFFATAGAICRTGATPVFIDIRPDSFNMDENLLADYFAEKCEPNTTGEPPRDKTTGRRVRAIMPVHLFGQCADMEVIMSIARRYNVPVIEDAAQALGARCNAGQAGSIGDIGCLSFYPTKNLGGFGDAGMIVTSDERLAERCRVIRVHGSSPKYYHARIGINSRLDALQAAVLHVGLNYLDEWMEMRRGHARAYDTSLRATTGITVPTVLPECYHTFNQYVIRSDRRDGLREFLSGEGIGTEIYYPLPLHLQECFSYLDYRRGDFPEAERAAAESLAIPMFPYLTDEQRELVCDAIKEYQKA
jgi:dTDP-4-amino-4,6-dideoxygalactose transaminase